MTEDWIIGFVWANGTVIENQHNKFLRVQNKNRELLLEIAAFLGMDINERASGLGNVDISQEHPVYKRVMGLGWTSRRNTNECCYPLDSIDDLEFVRGYCKTKASIAYGFTGVSRGNKRYLELRIRGASQLLFEINNKIMSWIAAKPRIAQRATRTQLFDEPNRKGSWYFICYAAEADVHALSTLLNIPLPAQDSGGRKKLSIDYAKEIAEARGGKCLSAKYLGSKKKLKWQCAEGHIWKATLTRVKCSKSWCPTCVNNNKRLTIEEMQEIAKSKGGMCLSAKYVNVHTKLKWQCAEGHVWEAKPGDVKQGTWCGVCNQRLAGQRTAGVNTDNTEKLIGMQKLAESRGGKCLSDTYINSYTKLTWQCAEGHIWEAIPSLIKNSKAWCPVCAHSKRRLAIKEMQKLAESKGGKCLSEKYVNSRTKLKWQCAEGHTWEATPDYVKYSGIWCTICSRKLSSNLPAGAGSYEGEKMLEMQKLAESRGGKCLSGEYVHSKAKLQWQCAKGHVWETVPVVIQRGSWCPVCARVKRNG